MSNALAKENISLAESKKSKRLNSLLDVLMAKVMKNAESNVCVNGNSKLVESLLRNCEIFVMLRPMAQTDRKSLPHSDFVPQKLGSSKRKPKKVHRIIRAPTTEDETLEDCESPNWFGEQVICNFSNLYPSFANLSVYPVEEILENPDEMLHENNIDFKETNEDKDHALSLLSYLQNYEYHDEIKGKCNVTGIVSTMELSTLGLHSHAHHTEATLTTFSQQQDEAQCGKDGEEADDECIAFSNPISRKIEIVISHLMETSAHDLNEQQKLRAALSEVLLRHIPITEVSSKYGIAVSAFQPYITRARVLLGQSPHPTSSNIKKKVSARLSDDNGQYANADEKDIVNKNTEPSQRDVHADDTKHEKQCDTGNLLTKLYESKNESMRSLSSSVVELYRSSDEFDESSKISRISIPIHDKQVENISSTSAEEIPRTRNTVLCTESGGVCRINEYDGLPRSIRGVARLLSNKKLGKLDIKEYTGMPENLVVKIDNVLRQYNFHGDREKMRDAIFEVLYNSKTLSEASRGNNLAATTLSTYVRLVKVLINIEKNNDECHVELGERYYLCMRIFVILAYTF
ncbi:unnamed protein product [Litomosoides sigmodontis]|uniref:HTH psq-type domain-containing protein n=1 Tax=Litomosoides sigmodontis TaxID=42156 RepID=A0A3P6T8A2_LITSI|nr:unnamed protein product [Litomosoides sigmodontis]